MPTLSKKIVNFLSKRLNKSESSIRVGISRLRTTKFPSTPSNAVAHIFARQHGLSVFQKLSKEDKLAIPNHEIIATQPKVSAKIAGKKENTFEFLKYETTDHFIRGHLKEINRTYNQKCYTATFILARKIVENLILDILIKNFPPSKLANKELYFDIKQNRFKDFSVILKSLLDKKNHFGIKKSVVERLYQKAKALKDDANDKTHSWYHLVEGKNEIDELHLQSIIELIKQLQ